MNTAQQQILSMFIDLVKYESGHLHDGMLITDESHRLVDRHPIAGRVAIACAGLLVTAHLAKLIDPEFDIISQRFILWRIIKGR